MMKDFNSLSPNTIWAMQFIITLLLWIRIEQVAMYLGSLGGRVGAIERKIGG